jgi:hypothetical protein
MRMRIFTNEVLQEDDLDYTRWETFNGDYVNVSEVGSAYIERCLDTLAIFTERYPNHPNYSIWMQYTRIFEQELFSRDTALYV